MRQRLLEATGPLHAPDLLDLEVLQAVRAHERAGRVAADLAARAAERLASARISRHPHSLVVRRVWDLRHNLSAYDAAYVALAELLDVPLLTLDGRLAAAPGLEASVEVLR